MAARGGRRIAAFDFLSPGKEREKKQVLLARQRLERWQEHLVCGMLGDMAHRWLESDRQTHGGEDRHTV